MHSECDQIKFVAVAKTHALRKGNQHWKSWRSVRQKLSDQLFFLVRGVLLVAAAAVGGGCSCLPSNYSLVLR